MEVWIKIQIDCLIEDCVFWEYKKLYFPHYVHNIHRTLQTLFDTNYLTVLQYEILKVKCCNEP